MPLKCLRSLFPQLWLDVYIRNLLIISDLATDIEGISLLRLFREARSVLIHCSQTETNVSALSNAVSSMAAVLSANRFRVNCTLSEYPSIERYVCSESAPVEHLRECLRKRTPLGRP